MELLEHVYDKLAEMSWNFTYREFSEIYLGRSGSYFSYLNTTGNPPSAEVMLNLWRELIKDREKYILLKSQSQCAKEQEMFGGWIDIYIQLADDVSNFLKGSCAP